MGARSYIADQFNNNIQKGLNAGLSAMDLLVDTQVKNNQDYIATQIKSELDFNVYSNPNTDDWDKLSKDVFNKAEQTINELNISSTAKHRLKNSVLNYAKSNYDASLQTNIDKTNLIKLSNELNNSMKLDASNTTMSLSDAFNSYLDSYNKSNEFASSHGVELTQPSDYLDVLIPTKSTQYVNSFINGIPSNFLDENGKAITPKIIAEQVKGKLENEIKTLTGRKTQISAENFANINSLASSVYNNKMAEITRDASNSKKAIVGEISSSKGMYDVESIKNYFNENYPQFVVDTVGQDLIDMGNYKNDQLMINDWLKDDSKFKNLSKAELDMIKTPELKKEITLNVATSKLVNLINSGKFSFDNDNSYFDKLGIELSQEERSKISEQIVENISPGSFKKDIENPILTAMNNKNVNNKTYLSGSSVVINSEKPTQTNTRINTLLENDRLNPFVADEELAQKIFKYVQTGHISASQADKFMDRPKFIDNISGQISSKIDSVLEGYITKNLSEIEITSLGNTIRNAAYKLYQNNPPQTAQDWDNYYTSVENMSKKETVNSFVKEMNKLKNTLNDNNFVNSFENKNIQDLLNNYQDGNLDFYIDPEQLSTLLFEDGAFDVNQTEFASVENLENRILKDFYDNQEYDELNFINQAKVKATANIAVAIRQERQLVNSYFDMVNMAPKKIGNRFVYQLQDSLYVSLYSYEDSIDDGEAQFLLITPQGAELSEKDLEPNHLSNRMVTLNSKYTMNGSAEERESILNNLKKSKTKMDSKEIDNPATYFIDDNGNKVSLKPSINQIDNEKEQATTDFNYYSEQGKALSNQIQAQSKKIFSEVQYLLYGRLGLRHNVLM